MRRREGKDKCRCNQTTSLCRFHTAAEIVSSTENWVLTGTGIRGSEESRIVTVVDQREFRSKLRAIVW